MTATDTLLVYFSGHGVLKEDLTLHLALPGTDESDLRWTSIPFEAIREILEESPCPNKILILDCCNSGRVLDTLMGTRTKPADTLAIRGTYILTSSANAPSYAPVASATPPSPVSSSASCAMASPTAPTSSPSAPSTTR